MEIKKVNGNHEDFFKMSVALQNFQFDLMPVLKDEGYSLTENLEVIEGFILYENKIPIASIGLKKIDETTCEIVRVFVDEKHRGKGYAKLLFSKIEELAKNMGFKKAEMVAWCKATSALTLYKKLNYISNDEKESEWFTGLKYVELYKEL